MIITERAVGKLRIQGEEQENLVLILEITDAFIQYLLIDEGEIKETTPLKIEHFTHASVSPRLYDLLCDFHMNEFHKVYNQQKIEQLNEQREVLLTESKQLKEKEQEILEGLRFFSDSLQDRLT